MACKTKYRGKRKFTLGGTDEDFAAQNTYDILDRQLKSAGYLSNEPTEDEYDFWQRNRGKAINTLGTASSVYHGSQIMNAENEGDALYSGTMGTMGSSGNPILSLVSTGSAIGNMIGKPIKKRAEEIDPETGAYKNFKTASDAAGAGSTFDPFRYGTTVLGDSNATSAEKWGAGLNMALPGYAALSGSTKKTMRRKDAESQAKVAEENRLEQEARFKYDLASLDSWRGKGEGVGNFFGATGGTIPKKYKALGGSIPGGELIPIASDTALAVGNSHGQGGMQVSPNAEIEGNEVIRENPEEGNLEVDSNRMGTSKVTLPLSIMKGQYENQMLELNDQIKNNDKLLTKEVDTAKKNTLKRQNEILIAKAATLAETIDNLDAQIKSAFNTQEAMKSTNPNRTFAYGGSVPGVPRKASGTRWVYRTTPNNTPTKPVVKAGYPIVTNTTKPRLSEEIVMSLFGENYKDHYNKVYPPLGEVDYPWQYNPDFTPKSNSVVPTTDASSVTGNINVPLRVPAGVQYRAYGGDIDDDLITPYQKFGYNMSMSSMGYPQYGVNYNRSIDTTGNSTYYNPTRSINTNNFANTIANTGTVNTNIPVMDDTDRLIRDWFKLSPYEPIPQRYRDEFIKRNLVTSKTSTPEISTGHYDKYDDRGKPIIPSTLTSKENTPSFDTTNFATNIMKNIGGNNGDNTIPPVSPVPPTTPPTTLSNNKPTVANKNKATNWDNFMNVAEGVAPYIDNIANYYITKKTPEIPEPILERHPYLKSTYNIKPELANVNDSVKSFSDSVEMNTANSNTANALKLKAFSEGEKSKRSLYGTKENTETQLRNNNAIINQQIHGKNAATINQHKMIKVQREAGMLQDYSKNISDAADNAMTQIENRNLRKYQDKQLALLALKDSDTGTWTRMLPIVGDFIKTEGQAQQWYDYYKNNPDVTVRPRAKDIESMAKKNGFNIKV